MIVVDTRDAGTYVWRSVAWSMLALFGVAIIAVTVVYEKWLFLLLLAVPFGVYFALMKPIVFPLGFYCALLPFDSMLSVTGQTKGATLTRLLAALAILTLFFKGMLERKLRAPKPVSILMVIFVCYAAISAIWAIDQSPAVSLLPTAGGLLILYLIVASYQFTRRDYAMLPLFILAGGLLASLITIYNVQDLYLGADISRTALSVGDRATQLNMYAFVLLLPVAICTKYIIEQKRNSVKMVFAVFLMLLLGNIVLTGSRGGMLAVGVIFVTYILSMRRRASLWVAMTCIIIIVIALAPGFIAERWQDTLETGGTGRVSIWKAGLKSLAKYWSLGAGLNNFGNVYSEYGRFNPDTLVGHLNRGAHNIYVGILVELGVFGFIIFIVGMWQHYRLLKPSSDNQVPDTIMLKAGMFGILAESIFQYTIWTKPFWLILMLIVVYKNVDTCYVDEKKYMGSPRSSPVSSS